jgi:para-nitrobenzyl esterase
MQARWAAFARTGDPNLPALPYWPCYTDDAASTLAIQPDEQVVALPDAARLAFFDSWFPGAPGARKAAE